jgi:hypothetical protein
MIKLGTVRAIVVAKADGMSNAAGRGLRFLASSVEALHMAQQKEGEENALSSALDSGYRCHPPVEFVRSLTAKRFSTTSGAPPI